MTRTLKSTSMLLSALICGAVLCDGYGLRSEEIQKVPYLPLVWEVLCPPTPVRSQGRIDIIYELHITNFYKGPISLRRIDALGDGKAVVKSYEGERLTQCLIRAGKPSDREDISVLQSGARAVLFAMVSFESPATVPDFLTHRITADYRRDTGEKVSAQAEGARVSIMKKQPLVIGPPVRPGVWLAGNGTGDGPVGHRLSMQPWNGELVVGQRYAIDFMKFGPDNRLVQGNTSLNSSWRSYGQEVLAVADGVVSGLTGTIIENTPLGKYAVENSLRSAAGNYIILDIGQGAYAVYAHLKPESLQVAVGDRVQKGQVLGLIGNSGISDAPHLHFHLLNSDSVFGGEGIPFVFEQFDLLGAYESTDGNSLEAWTPTGPSSTRHHEIPTGDMVMRFP